MFSYFSWQIGSDTSCTLSPKIRKLCSVCSLLNLPIAWKMMRKRTLVGRTNKVKSVSGLRIRFGAYKTMFKRPTPAPFASCGTYRANVVFLLQLRFVCLFLFKEVSFCCAVLCHLFFFFLLRHIGGISVSRAHHRLEHQHQRFHCLYKFILKLQFLSANNHNEGPDKAKQMSRLICTCTLHISPYIHVRLTRLRNIFIVLKGNYCWTST